MTTLLDAVRRYAGAHAAEGGLAQTPIPGLTTVRATAPSGLMHAISRPLVCLVLQGAKRVTMGAQSFDFAAGDSLLITADVPTVSQITRASVAAPYLSLVLELDPAVVTDLAIQMKAVLVGSRAPVRADPTDTEAADAALRLMRLLAARPRCRCSARSWCGSCITGCWPAATARQSGISAGRTARRVGWRGRSRICARSLPSRCQSSNWRRWLA
jgi:hypothetical protein